MICALCRNEKELRNSHLIPKSAYRHIRDSREEGGGSPMRVHLHLSESFFTDTQVKKYLLCEECEQLFSKRGEGPVSKMWATHTHFPLLEQLLSSVSTQSSPNFSLFNPVEIKADILESLFYFGASVVWRSNVWDWGSHPSIHKGTLGRLYEGRFKDYLLGNTDAIKDVRLIVTLNTNYNLHRLLRFPACIEGPGCCLHEFDVLGIFFKFIVGKNPAPEFKAVFEQAETNTIILGSDMSKSNDLLSLANDFHKAFPDSADGAIR